MSESIENNSNTPISPQYISLFLDSEITENEYLIDYSKISVNNPQLSYSEIRKLLPKDVKELLLEHINDLYKRNIYDGKTKSHSTNHIENVMLFATLIGSSLNLNKHDLELLIEAAKYHDSERISDYDTPKKIYKTTDQEIDSHGLDSASRAGIELAKNYSKDDLKIIQIAIEYHVPEDDEILLEELFEKYEIDTNKTKLCEKIKLMISCLKDADALDRTRFLAESSYFVKDYYLRLDISKKLIKIACQLNEKEAIEQLKRISESNPDILPLINQAQEKHYNPKEVLKEYMRGKLEVFLDESKTQPPKKKLRIFVLGSLLNKAFKFQKNNEPEKAKNIKGYVKLSILGIITLIICIGIIILGVLLKK